LCRREGETFSFIIGWAEYIATSGAGKREGLLQ